MQAIPVLEEVQRILGDRMAELVVEEGDDGANEMTAKQREMMQLLAADLLTVDYLPSASSDAREPFLKWVGSLEPAWFSTALEKRQNYKDAADVGSAETEVLRVEEMLKVCAAARFPVKSPAPLLLHQGLRVRYEPHML